MEPSEDHTPLFLVVSNETATRKRIRELLEQGGYVVLEALDHEQAMAGVLEGRPDIVVIDADRDGLDGIELCRSIERSSEAGHVRVILITGRDDDEAVDEAFDAGVSEYVTKPIHWAVLRNRLKHLGMKTTEEKRAYHALGQARAEWEQIFNSIQDPVLLVTPEGVITEANPAALHRARKTRVEVVGKGACQILHGGRLPHIKCPLEELLRTKTKEIMETKLPGLHGEYLLTVSPIPGPGGEVRQTLLMVRDLTEEEVRKAEAMRTAHLAAIGELAAGVAHEINNPINGIINYAQILLDEAPDGTLQVDILARIIKEGERISFIVRNLLSFARDQEKDVEEQIEIEKIIEDSLSLIQHQMRKDGISLELEIDSALPLVRGNPQQLQQVVLNLLSNSRYALNQRFPSLDPQKRLRIQANRITLEGKPFVRMTITDWGTGIPQGILDRIFDPFFSTKPPGEGTGLGLSISHGIVRDHQGAMRVESFLNDHTTIIVDLPASGSLS